MVTAQRDIISSWSARMVANVTGAKKPPWMEMDQWWRPWHRTGHSWIEKCNMNLLTATRERMLCWAGHVARIDYSEICAKALRCQVTSEVEMATAPLERSGERQVGTTAPKVVQHLQMGGCGIDRGFQLCWKRRWLCGSWTMAGDRKNWEKPDGDVVLVMAQWGYISHLGSPCVPTEPVARFPPVASNGVKWRWWLRVASVSVGGGYKWYKVRRITTRWRENEREESDELFARSLLRGEFFFFQKIESVSMVQRWT